jgi:DNA primase
MARIPQRFIDDLLDRADIVDVVGARVDLRKTGKNYSARCPFHDEKTPSFTVSPDKQFYYCFGCGASGNAIGFVMDYDRVEFPRAVEQLASHCGLEVPREAASSPAESRHKKLHEILRQADLFYRTRLRRHPGAGRAVDYLKKRGLSGEIAARFGIGFAPPGWDNLIKELATDDERLKLLTEAGLVIRQEGAENRVYDRFRNRIQFPIRDTRGRTLGFGGRVLDDAKPKYLNSPETPVFHKGRELYGLYEAHQALREIPCLIVVEGYMDVVALAQHGIDNAVATLGTSATGDHLEKLYRYTEEVVFCFDGDEAGRKAARRALETCLPAMEDGRSARFLFLPEGEDPDTLVRREGPEGFRRLMADASSLSDFLFNALSNDLNLESLDGKARLSKLAAPLINRLPRGVYRQLMLKELARRTDMEVTELETLVAPAAAPADDSRDADKGPVFSDDGPPPEAYDTGADDRFAPDDPWGAPDYPAAPVPAGRPDRRLKLSAVQRLIALLIHEPQLVDELEVAGLDHLDDPDGPLLAKLVRVLREHPDYTLNHILGHWRAIHSGNEEAEALARIAATDLFRPPGNTERDNLAEFRDIHRHLKEKLHRGLPARVQLDKLLDKATLSPDERKQLLALWHNELPGEERTEELNIAIKRALTAPRNPKSE